MIGHNKYTKAISDSFVKKLFYGKSIKSVKKSCFDNLLYFLIKVIARLNDIGACFIEYVFECYFL